MAHIRTWKELQKLGTTPAEDQLIEACKKGGFCQLEDGELPREGSPAPSRHIRADVLRYLILVESLVAKSTISAFGSKEHTSPEHLI